MSAATLRSPCAFYPEIQVRACVPSRDRGRTGVSRDEIPCSWSKCGAMVVFDHVLARRFELDQPARLGGLLLVVETEITGDDVVAMLLQENAGVLAGLGLRVVAAHIALDDVADAR